MLKLRITTQANQDLLDIGEYTEREWGNEQREKYIKQLFDRINWLSRNPQLGKPRPEIKEGDYSFSEGKHLIFYFFDDEKLTVIAILHERMDFVRHL
jgi:toxin ParE1/3/4